MGQVEDLQLIPKPDLRIIDDFVIHWDLKRGGRIGPRAADIVSPDFAAHLRNSFIVDILDSGADFYYSFIGSRLVESVGRDRTGWRVSDLYRDQPEASAKLLEIFRLPATQKCPIYVRGRIFWLPTQDRRNFAAALVPLSEDGFAVSAILSELFVFSNEFSHR